MSCTRTARGPTSRCVCCGLCCVRRGCWPPPSTPTWRTTTRALPRRGLHGTGHATLPMVDQLVCVSASLRRRLVKRGYPAARMRSSVRRWAPDPTRPHRAGGSGMFMGGGAGRYVRRSPQRSPACMQAIDAPDALWIGTVARLVPVKDIDLMLDASAILLGALPQARVAIVGDGRSGPGWRHAPPPWGGAAGGIHRRVESIWPALARCSAYWLTSVSEGLRSPSWRPWPPGCRWWPRTWAAWRGGGTTCDGGPGEKGWGCHAEGFGGGGGGPSDEQRAQPADGARGSGRVARDFVPGTPPSLWSCVRAHVV